MRQLLRAAAAVACLSIVFSTATPAVDASVITAAKVTNSGVAPTQGSGVTLNGGGWNAGGTGPFTYDVNANPDNILFRTITGDSSSTAFVSFCIEVNEHTDGFGVDEEYEIIALESAPKPDTALTNLDLNGAGDVLRRMWYEQITTQFPGAPAVLNVANAKVAFQMAVWELVYDTGTDLSTGLFTANQPGGAIALLAQSYLDSAVANVAGKKANLYALSPTDGLGQDQVIEIVPEPASVLAWTLIGGCFVAGHRIRRGKWSLG
jgi:hypothetical protein